MKDLFLFLLVPVALVAVLALGASSCKANQTIVDEVLQDSRNVCYGDLERFFPGISACSYINLLDESINVFLCFPYQMFSNNCSWQRASEWLGICKQPMTYNNFHNGVVFCYRKPEEEGNRQSEEKKSIIDSWLLPREARDD